MVVYCHLLQSAELRSVWSEPGRNGLSRQHKSFTDDWPWQGILTHCRPVSGSAELRSVWSESAQKGLSPCYGEGRVVRRGMLMGRVWWGPAQWNRATVKTRPTRLVTVWDHRRARFARHVPVAPLIQIQLFIRKTTFKLTEILLTKAKLLALSQIKIAINSTHRKILYETNLQLLDMLYALFIAFPWIMAEESQVRWWTLFCLQPHYPLNCLFFFYSYFLKIIHLK